MEKNYSFLINYEPKISLLTINLEFELNEKEKKSNLIYKNANIFMKQNLNKIAHWNPRYQERSRFTTHNNVFKEIKNYSRLDLTKDEVLLKNVVQITKNNNRLERKISIENEFNIEIVLEEDLIRFLNLIEDYSAQIYNQKLKFNYFDYSQILELIREDSNDRKDKIEKELDFKKLNQQRKIAENILLQAINGIT